MDRCSPLWCESLWGEFRYYGEHYFPSSHRYSPKVPGASTNRATRDSVCHRWVASVRTLYILHDGMVRDAERSCERCHFCWFVDLLRHRIGRILISTAASRNLCRWFDPPSRIAHPDISSRIGKDPANHFRRAYNNSHTNCRTSQAPTP